MQYWKTASPSSIFPTKPNQNGTSGGASPEFVRHKDDPPLQQQRGKHPDHLPHAETLEQAVKVHVLQSGVAGPPQLNDLGEKKHHKKKEAQVN